jgi:hypothetical protein
MIMDFMRGGKMDRQTMQKLLQESVCKVSFTKQDGTVRDMVCTLMESIIVPHEKKTDRVKTEKEDIIAVWDTEKNAWRSFKISSIISFSPL